MPVTLVIQHAKRMCHNFICGLPDSTTLFSLFIEFLNDNTTAFC
jgi:hypothetical protein